jgi:hypothetical protein
VDIRIQCLCIDTDDPARIASFWQSALGWRRTYEEEGEVVLEPPERSRENGIVPDLLFLKVPEPKTAKNRMHVDVLDPSPGAVDRLISLGATVAGRHEMRWAGYSWARRAAGHRDRYLG